MLAVEGVGQEVGEGFRGFDGFESSGRFIRWLNSRVLFDCGSSSDSALSSQRFVSHCAASRVVLRSGEFLCATQSRDTPP